MKSAFEGKGIWWVSGSDLRLNGHCSWDPASGVTLVIETRSEAERQFFSGLSSGEFKIHGRLVSIPYVTIEHAMIVSLPYAFDGNDVRIYAPAMIKSDALCDSSMCMVKDMHAEISGMNSWVDDTSVVVSRDKGVTVAQCSGRREEFFFESDELRINVVYSNRNTSSRFRFTADSVAAFELTSSQPFRFDVGLGLLRELRAFLALALDRSVIFESIEGRSSVDLELPEIGLVPSTMEYYEAESKEAIERSRADDGGHRALFKLKPIEASSRAFGVFLEIYRKHRMPMDFFFSQLYGGRSYTYQQFVDIVHGIEGLHRGVYGGEFMTEERFSAEVLPFLIAAIPSSVDANFRTSLKSRMSYLYQFSLRRRLTLLANSHKECFSMFINDPGSFAETVADMRNEIAHPTGAREQNAELENKYFVMMHRVRVLFQLELLHLMGFPVAHSVGRVKSLASSLRAIKQLPTERAGRDDLAAG